MENDDRQKERMELTTFFVGNALCGIDILKVQEINKLMEMTEVPQAPEYINGILNLRGQIITIIDLGKKLGLGQTQINVNSRNIIVNGHGEHIGMFVKQISDVVVVNPQHIEPAPANMKGIQGDFFTGVYKTEDKLIGILNVARVLGFEHDQPTVKA
jgi:purine-binding chemotaxis protein CheW